MGTFKNQVVILGIFIFIIPFKNQVVILDIFI